MTIQQALLRVKYSEECPKTVNAMRWRAMLRHIERFYRGHWRRRFRKCRKS
jgi:hypothetical protein